MIKINGNATHRFNLISNSSSQGDFHMGIKSLGMASYFTHPYKKYEYDFYTGIKSLVMAFYMGIKGMVWLFTWV